MVIKIYMKWLSNLRFADDISLFAQDMETLKKMALDVVETSEKAGLKINVKKTVLLTKTVGRSDVNLELVIKGKNLRK